MTTSYTPAELAASLGTSIRRLRIDRNLKQEELAAQAGVSVHALQNLESGEGATVRTLVPRGASERKRARKARHAE